MTGFRFGGCKVNSRGAQCRVFICSACLTVVARAPETNSPAYYVFDRLCPDCCGMVSDKFVSGDHATVVSTLGSHLTTISSRAVSYYNFRTLWPLTPSSSAQGSDCMAYTDS